MIFWDDWNTSQIQSALQRFMQIRNQKNLTPTMSLYIDKHQGGLYAAYTGSGATSECNGSVAMKLGTSSWSPCGTGWQLATSGTNYAIWTK